MPSRSGRVVRFMPSCSKVIGEVYQFAKAGGHYWSMDLAYGFLVITMMPMDIIIVRHYSI